jgi:glycosyltransferase involved in cell wall biosynthesis
VSDFAAKNHERVTDYLSREEVKTLLCGSLKYSFHNRPRVRIVRGSMPEEPLVTVIIPTFNRSDVLRLAIQSVLWQTEQNFELLVIGDACTDDSEAVAGSFGDARIRWHNLAVNSGNQSGPINAGVGLARGRYIALLGHDDVWHPEHLRIMAKTIVSSGADFVSSLIEMIGPAGTNYRVITGIYPNGVYDPNRGLPPSGLIYKRDVPERIGEWKHYRTVWQLPEAEFAQRAHAAGLRFVSTGALTVFKFNSAFRKNSYVEKSCHEQAAYIKAIQKRRWFMLQEAISIAWVHLRRLPMYVPVFAPPPAPRTPGWSVTQYRKMRGLE